MYFREEFKKNPDRLSDVLPWAALVASGVVLNKDGSYQRTIRFRGPDLDSATKGELISISARINNAFKRLRTGWAIYIEAQREKKKDYPESVFPDPVTHLIDEERRALFQDLSYFESEYFLTFVYMPPGESARAVSQFFLKREKKTKEKSQEDVLSHFLVETERLISLLSGALPEVRELTDQETLSYLHAAATGKSHGIVVPEVPMYLDALLGYQVFETGFTPVLGDKFVKVVGIYGYPGSSTPALLDALNRLSISYRWVSRFLPLDAVDSAKELDDYRRKWKAAEAGIKGELMKAVTGGEPTLLDPTAQARAQDAEEALFAAKDGVVSFGYYTLNVLVMDEDLERAEAGAREIERILNTHGFSAKLEDTNAADAYLGSLPGNCRHNIRRPLLSSLNLAHMMPLSAVWLGPERDDHLGGPVLFQGVTGGASRFRFTPTVGDVQHSMIIGPTGAGKSVLLNFMDAQFRRYKDAQVYIFDKGGSSRILTYAVGGDFYELMPEGTGLSFQPLADVDDAVERAWAHEWLLGILAQENVEITTDVKDSLWLALCSLAETPVEQRTIYALTAYVQHAEVRKALRPYTIVGKYGKLLDSNVDNLRESTWQAFEMEHLMEVSKKDGTGIIAPVLDYLFHRLRKRFTGAPTRIRIDEAWLALDNPVFSARMRVWLKELRKYNVGVVFATQSLADVEGSEIAATIREACHSKIYLPNQTALNEHMSALYREFGLNERQIQILAESTPKRHYYYTSPLGNRLFELSLSEIALAYCGATSVEKQREAQEIFDGSFTLDQFNRRYLERSGIEWAVKYFKEY